MHNGSIWQQPTFTTHFGTDNRADFAPTQAEAFTCERASILVTPIEIELIVKGWLRVFDKASCEMRRGDASVESRTLRLAAEQRIEQLIAAGAISRSRAEQLAASIVHQPLGAFAPASNQ